MKTNWLRIQPATKKLTSHFQKRRKYLFVEQNSLSGVTATTAFGATLRLMQQLIQSRLIIWNYKAAFRESRSLKLNKLEKKLIWIVRSYFTSMSLTMKNMKFFIVFEKELNEKVVATQVLHTIEDINIFHFKNALSMQSCHKKIWFSRGCWNTMGSLLW